MSITLTLADWGSLFLHFISLSLLSVGGAITTAPDIHRYLVDETHWLSETQFTASIALAQGAPGPNVLFVALMGWNVGLNAGGGIAAGWPAISMALWGVFITMAGMLIPSCTLTFLATQWAHRNRDMLAVKAFKAGMAPIVIALLIATGWLLTGSHDNPAKDWPMWLVAAATTLIVWKTKTHMLVLLAIGALLGALGWI
ncbi:chromate transporter [Limnohabitans sp.]|uniref:chromate transporter n=1 Tax=Limnohabitans sp. TaxID=1907725 RepID=UPI002FDDBD03